MKSSDIAQEGQIVAVVLAEHRLERCLALADRVIAMIDGMVACDAPPAEFLEWALLQAMPARVVAKTRHLITRGGVAVAVDEFADGTLLAEIDDGDSTSADVPTWLDVIEDVSADERWTGAALAR